MQLFIIGGIKKTSLVDFPGKVAAVVFTQGCNFRCGYCHNPSLVVLSPHWGEGAGVRGKDFLSFLKTRIDKLDGVVISGGEPTLQSGLYDFIKEIKKMGFDVKLDTNGTNPDIVEQLLNDNLVDYIAMDIKAPLKKYEKIVDSIFNIENIPKTIDMILNSSIDYEFRTTVIKSQLTLDDFDKIGQMIKGAKHYYLQKFVPSNILDNNLMNEQTYTDEEFKIICKNLKKYVEFADYR